MIYKRKSTNFFILDKILTDFYSASDVILECTASRAAV